MQGLGLLLTLAAVIAIWFWATRARERVDLISREVCKDLHLQRLDESVTLRRLTLASTPSGFRIRRIFSFEFSTNGADRHRGDVCLHGAMPAWIRVDHPDGPVVIDLESA